MNSEENIVGNSDLTDVLERERIKLVIKDIGTELIEAFDYHLVNDNARNKLPKLLREIENKLHVTKQPTKEGIVKILKEVLLVDTHINLSVGDILNGSRIESVFGRNPKQEGINFCTATKELFVITKIGSNNPAVEFAEYNDYWYRGKIMYEGKGQDIQQVKGSNLHLYRKYQVFNNKIKCKDDVPEYIHVFNKVSNTDENKFMYLGKFDVTDIFVNEHSVGRLTETKTALIFELTPRVDNRSSIIDANYIF